MTDPLAQIAAPTPCPNCGADRLGPFCQNCGQPEAARLTIRGFVKLASSRMFSMDRGFLRTFIALSRGPGRVALEFVEGRRAWYTNPLAYWLLAATVQLFGLWLVDAHYTEYLREGMEGSIQFQGEVGEASMARYAEIFKVDDPLPVLVDITVGGIKAAYTYMGILFALAFALLLRLLANFRRESFNLAEQFVFALYLIGHWTMITGLMMPLTVRLSPIVHSAIGTLGYFVISAWGSVQFHRAGVKGAVVSVIAMLGALIAFMIMLAFAVLVGIFMRAAAA